MLKRYYLLSSLVPVIGTICRVFRDYVESTTVLFATMDRLSTDPLKITFEYRKIETKKPRITLETLHHFVTTLW